jgi:alkanesulfonate monooxygenase SsuD/methylene tetrahydromethanopterin reductase-like flavin-dependent oxidoreductase (luciferase family)
VGRDPAEINKTALMSMIPGRTQAEAEQIRDQFLGRMGVQWSDLDEAARTNYFDRVIMGGPEALEEQLRSLLAAGLDGITVNLPVNGHDPEIVALAGEVITKALS